MYFTSIARDHAELCNSNSQDTARRYSRRDTIDYSVGIYVECWPKNEREFGEHDTTEAHNVQSRTTTLNRRFAFNLIPYSKSINLSTTYCAAKFVTTTYRDEERKRNSAADNGRRSVSDCVILLRR